MIEPMTLTESLASPPTRHAVLVHLPLALGMLGVPIVIATAVIRKHLPLRIVTIALYVLLAGSCMLAVDSGEAAQEHLPGDMAGFVSDAVDAHASIARSTYFGAGAVVVLLAIAMLTPAKFSLPLGWIGVVAAVITSGLMVITGHRGGVAVYQYGAGTPDMPRAAPPPAPEIETITEGSASLASQTAVFNAMAYPILEKYCLQCHGHGTSPKAGLSLATLAQTRKGGSSGAVVIPGDPEGSLLMQRITAEDPNDLMPPSGERLPDADIAVLRQWIETGMTSEPDNS